MRCSCQVVAVIPAFNEEKSLGEVLDQMPAWVDRVVVAENASTDGTAHIARLRGAFVVREDRRGYGAACQAGLATLHGRLRSVDAVVFLDADGSDDPREMARLLDPLLRGEADLVIGVRQQRGRMPRHQRLGTSLIAGLLGVCFDTRVADLGPYRAIRWGTLAALGMRDRRFGWTAEMQARALRQRRRILEVPVGWRPGGGRSTISGSLRGSLRAGRDLSLAVLAQAIAARWDRAARWGEARGRWRGTRHVPVARNPVANVRTKSACAGSPAATDANCDVPTGIHQRPRTRALRTSTWSKTSVGVDPRWIPLGNEALSGWNR